MSRRFQNRTEAGQQLAQQLTAYANRSNVLVLGLPRGGVPVAFEIAKALGAPLDVCLVRKLGVPGHQELAMGAIVLGGIRVLNQQVLEWLHISEAELDAATAREQQELERRDRNYRCNRPLLDLQGRIVILVDDGIATGSTLRAAIAVLKRQQPQQIIVAVPVGPPCVCRALQAEVDEVVCLLQPDSFSSISLWYEDFTQITDREVMNLLQSDFDDETAASQTLTGSVVAAPNPDS